MYIGSRLFICIAPHIDITIVLVLTLNCNSKNNRELFFISPLKARKNNKVIRAKTSHKESNQEKKKQRTNTKNKGKMIMSDNFTKRN